MHRRIMAAVAGLVLIVSAAFFVNRAVEPAAAVSFDDAPVRVRIDLSERAVYLEQNGDTIMTYSAAVGSAKHPTPRGDFAMRRVIWNPRWVPPNAAWAKGKKPAEAGDPNNPMGRVKIFFREPDYYVHGTNAESSIGTASSHGCVRLRNEDVIDLAQRLVEHGEAPVEPGLIQRLINRVRQTKELRLSRAIPLRVQA